MVPIEAASLGKGYKERLGLGLSLELLCVLKKFKREVCVQIYQETCFYMPKNHCRGLGLCMYKPRMRTGLRCVQRKVRMEMFI